MIDAVIQVLEKLGAMQVIQFIIVITGAVFVYRKVTKDS